MDEETVQQLRMIVADLESAEARLRKGDASNLTNRKVFAALATARKLLRDLDPQANQ